MNQRMGNQLIILIQIRMDISKIPQERITTTHSHDLIFLI
jgi:hypothetical protein